MKFKPRIVIHGGAGAIPKSEMNAEAEATHHTALTAALEAGFDVLAKQGTSLDAVRVAVQNLEDSPLFNAAYGAVITKSGTIELDAAIMDGANLKAGAVAGISHIKNPIVLAQKILEHAEHVLLTGRDAEVFAQSLGMPLFEAKKHITERQLKRWQELKNKPNDSKTEHDKHGTVGAVALDSFGNLAAATSTGGMMNKTPGRVGDSPIIGAGTYADNHTCAISATGHGEFFIRLVIAYDITAQMKYLGLSLEESTKATLQRLTKLGGTGGVIAIDQQGNISMPFNTEGMYRGYKDSTECKTFIY